MGATLAVAAPGDVSPAVALGTEVDHQEDVVWWVVVVGFAYAVALAWATWCRISGGNAEISFGWSGFKIVCRSK